MASSSKCLSDFLSSIAPKQGDEDNGEAEDVPDWLLGSDDEEEGTDVGEQDRGGEDEKEDPFFFLTTPIKPTGKAEDGELEETPKTATGKRKAEAEAGSTPGETPGGTGKGAKKKKGSKASASTAVTGTIPIKNPDKIIFNRLLLEIPYMGQDSVDLSGDVGAVGRILMHSLDDVATEPQLIISDTPNGDAADPAKRSGAADGASLDNKRLQPDSQAATDLAGPSAGNSAGVRGVLNDPVAVGDVGTGDPGSNGKETNGQLASGSRRRGSAKRSSGVDTDSAKDKSDEDEDHEDEEMSEGYVNSEEESEGSDRDFDGPVGNKQKQKAGKGSGKPDAAAGRDEVTQQGNNSFMIDLKGVMFSANVVQMPCTALVVHVGDTQAKVEAVLNEFVQMEKKTFMSEYEEGDAGDADFNLGGHGVYSGSMRPQRGAVDEDLPKDAQKAKAGKNKKPVITSGGRVVNRATKGKAKKGGKKAAGSKRK